MKHYLPVGVTVPATVIAPRPVVATLVVSARAMARSATGPGDLRVGGDITMKKITLYLPLSGSLPLGGGVNGYNKFNGIVATAKDRIIVLANLCALCGFASKVVLTGRNQRKVHA
jgi:hypothetical protein